MRSVRSSVRRSRSGGFLRDRSRQRFVILAILIAITAFTGGSYRPTMPSLIMLRPLLVLGIGAMVMLPGGWNWSALRTPAILLALFALTMVMQLIPLPPGWWAAIPGHERYTGIAALAPDAARPISLVPDLTINSVLALLPALAVLIAFAGMGERDRWNTLWIVLAVGAGSIMVGLFQAAGGNGPTALATQSDEGVVTGFLANRNHGAVLLAAMLPLATVPLRHHVARPLTRWLVLGAAAAVLLPLILLSGSRQGMILGLVALAVAALLLLERGRNGIGGTGRQRLFVVAGGLAALAAIGVAVVVSGRALSVDRLAALADPSNEARFRSFPIVVRMTQDFWPFGIGYGAFDPVYRGYEPDAFLHSSYFNRAHNDLLETVMSGGLPALLLLVALLAWLGARSIGVLRRRSADPAGLAAAAITIVALMLLASLVDYPLRTGIMSSVFVIACCWLATTPVPPRMLLPGSAPQGRGDARRTRGDRR